VRVVAFLLTVLVAFFANPATAHKPSDSYLHLSLRQGATQLEGQWDIALRDLDFALDLDRDRDGTLTWGEVRRARTEITEYALNRLNVEVLGSGDRAACALTAKDLLIDQHVDGYYAVIRFGAECGIHPERLIVHYKLLFDVDATHRGLLNVSGGGSDQAEVLSTDAPVASFSIGSPGRWHQFHGFVIEGIWHILKGYDHILFLLTLLFPAVLRYGNTGWLPRPGLRESGLDVLQIVTAFTIAHSLTLTLATLGFVHLPTRWVESAIAVTVLLGALNNLRPVVTSRRWAVAFAFGLIHGFGFASVLADLGIHGSNLVLALVGFNGGVEIGQLLIVSAVLPVAFVGRHSVLYRRAFMPAGAAAISVLAGYWLVVRLTTGGVG
jgi:HupE / UreJ protein